jgi:hypothetical protein
MNEEVEKLFPPIIPVSKDEKPRWATIEHECGFEEKVPLNFAALLSDLKSMKEISCVHEELKGPVEE